MKFGKRLRDQMVDTLPDWRNKFLSYKQLKKKLKSLPGGENEPDSPAKSLSDASPRETTSEEMFIKLLNTELEKFNNFFMEKEEEFVIRMQVLKEDVERLKAGCADGDLASCADCADEVNNIRRLIVSLHGEMVLLENYSALNYTGLVKILKKHDKRSQSQLRQAFISNVLRQPFLTTEILGKLVRECEQRIQTMFPAYSSAGSQICDRSCGGDAEEESAQGDRESSPDSLETAAMEPGEPGAVVGEGDVETIYRCALSALRSLQEIRGSSRTPHPLLADAAASLVSYQKAKDSESGAGLGRSAAQLAGEARPGCSATSTPKSGGERAAEPRSQEVSGNFPGDEGGRGEAPGGKQEVDGTDSLGAQGEGSDEKVSGEGESKAEAGGVHGHVAGSVDGATEGDPGAGNDAAPGEQ